MIVLSDSSPLITLAGIGYLNILPRLYQSVVITPEVYQEVAVNGAGLTGSQQTATASWVNVQAVSRRHDLDVAKVQSGLGAGELSTIVLAKELNADLVLLDDRQARKLAKAEDLTILGCVGLLETAFDRRIIGDLGLAFKALLRSDAWISPVILNASLARNNLPPLDT